ncbi:MAG: alpha-mannosidase, partial [Chloroflexia bacterium]|nr:alpha-mannosidase [Chloroflexia bacterium]
AHIDLAWLWPLAETRRTIRRTVSSVLRLMDQYPDFTFNQSSAQVYAWLEEDDPTLFERVRARIAEGRWEAVGGSWTEPDCQVTGGEAFVRQLFYGQRYVQERFGIRNRVAWLPDVFGFSGAIPQLLRGAGIDAFFTTKLNWNESNTFPYDLFAWEGIDGSRVVAHSFLNPSPAHGYNGNIAPQDTLHTWKSFRGKRQHDQTMLAFGWGDGGGGPSEQMLEQYARIKDYPVLPRLSMGKVEEFFADLTNLPAEDLPVYVGEQYLELHRATLTTQALTKQLNRAAEHRLGEAEAFAALVGGNYPHAELDDAWKTLLLHQFHDILPGSSIHEVYEDTHPALRGVIATATRIRDDALATIAGGGTGGSAVGNAGLEPQTLTVLLPEGAGPVATSEGRPVPMQAVEGGMLAHAPERKLDGLSVLNLAAIEEDDTAPVDSVTAMIDTDHAVIENALLRVEIGGDGTLHRVLDKHMDRDALVGRGNQLWAYIDRPRSWDAWDIDETYEQAGEEIATVDAVDLVEEGPLRAAVRVRRTWRSTTITQTYRLLSGSTRLDIVSEIDWHERLMLLRARFPVNVHAHEATFETMYGVEHRPTHRNTTWERIRFEVSAHRFVDLSEPGYGVALLNDSKYGHSVLGQTIGISLVRGPLYPDPLADEGAHRFTYSLFPHRGTWVEAGVTHQARALNSPLVAVPAATDAHKSDPFVTIHGLDLAFGALKRAHDRDALVVRVYEPHGARGRATLSFRPVIRSVRRVNLLEEELDDGQLPVSNQAVELDVRPFEVISLLIEV